MIWPNRLQKRTAKTLLAVVSFSKTNPEGRIPTPDELKDFKSLGIDVRTAAGRIGRLRRQHYFVRSSDGAEILNPSLCHLKNSAQLLLLVFNEAMGSLTGCCKSDKVLRRSTQKKIRNPRKVMKNSLETGYLTPDSESDQSRICVGTHLHSHKHYLELLAESS